MRKAYFNCEQSALKNCLIFLGKGIMPEDNACFWQEQDIIAHSKQEVSAILRWRQDAVEKRPYSDVIVHIGLHNKHQGCDESVASAAGPFTPKKTYEEDGEVFSDFQF